MPLFECSVFSGMYAALQQSLPTIASKLNLYTSGGGCEDAVKLRKLVITGHSLGGGYAQLFTAHLLSAPEFESYFESVRCVTFGAPLVFCKDVRCSFFYEKLAARCLHFVYQFDLVPRCVVWGSGVV